MTIPRRDLSKVCGLLLILVGVLLIDRSFSAWRNDGRNFPNQNGVYLPPEQPMPPPTFLQRAGPRHIVIASGLGCLLLSIVLLGTPGVGTDVRRVKD